MVAFRQRLTGVAVSIFLIAVVLAAFYVTQTPFEKVVISSLVLLYIVLLACYRAILAVVLQTDQAAMDRFAVTMATLNNSNAEEYRTAAETKRNQNDRALIMALPYIAGEFVVGIIALYEIITAVF